MTVFTKYLTAAVLPEAVIGEIFDSSVRSATIVAAATIDDELKRKLQERLRPCSDPDRDPLFDSGERPLGSFNAKIILAERVGVIEAEFAAILHRVRDIRNKYAHRASFSETSFRDMRDSLVRDFFFGTAVADPEYFGATPEMAHGSDVVFTYAHLGTPLEKMFERGADQQDVSYRMMLLAVIGFLAGHSFNEPGASLIDISYRYSSKEDGRKIIHAIGLVYEKQE